MQFESLPKKKNNKIFFLLIILAVASITLVWLLIKDPQPSYIPPPQAGKQENSNFNRNPEKEDLIPKDSKTPEEFLAQVQEKAKEIQKQYDSNLTDFSKRKWQKLFLEINGLDNGYIQEHITILEGKTQRLADQSIIFEIKYIVKSDNADVENNDFFYLLVSEAKKNELEITNVEADTFLNDEQIKSNLGKERFARISKIEKESPNN